jgi:hypothetical protein
MEAIATEKQQIEHTIERARAGLGESIDALDRELRKTLDFKTAAAEHAPQLLAGGAMLGFLVGFGFPKVLKRVIQVGVPVALIAYKVQQVRARRA